MKRHLTAIIRKRFSQAITGVVATLAAVAVISCNGSVEKDRQENGENTGEEVAVSGVSLSESAVTAPMGSTITLTATVSPENAANKGVTWSSSDKSVATVDKGVVTCHKDGKATIKVTTLDGFFTAQCEVTVATILADKIWLDSPSATIAVGESWTYNLRIEPDNSNVGTEVIIQNPDAIELSEDGRTLKGLKEGIASFIVRTADGSLQTRGWVNVVDKRVFPTGANFLIDQSYAVGSSIKVKSYSSSGYPRIEWTPADANDLDFDLTSEDESIVSVKPDWYNSYDVSFLKAGTTTLKFWSYIYETGTSFRKDVDIHVYNGKPNLSYDYSDFTFWSGWTLCLIPDGLTGKIDLKFENIYDRNFVITNANEFAEYITVSSNRVTAKKVGKTTISLRARSDPSHTLNIPVTIFDRPTDLSFGLASDNEVIEVKKGAEQIIYVYTKPESSIGRYNVSTSSGYLSAEMKPGVREQKPFTPMPDNFKTLKLKAGNVTGLFTVTLTHKDNSSVKKTLNVRVIN